MENLDKKFKQKISLKEFEVTNSSASDLVNNNDLKTFCLKEAGFKFKSSIVRMKENELEFDIIGYDAAIANALRRTLLSDVPSMAIEKVYMMANTSIMQDDILSHRLGLLPLKADPRLFNFPPSNWTPENGSERDTLEFTLSVKCLRDRVNEKVFTRDLQWVPRGDQESWIGNSKPGPVSDDILINKLRPGHELDFKVFAVKGTGRDHAKFSPVCTVYYRMMPSICIVKPVVGESAVRLQKCFSPGVIEIKEGTNEAVVANERIDSRSRNVNRYEDLRECVVLDKINDHFIFSVESVGATNPVDLVSMAWDVIIEKCEYFIEELKNKSRKS